jgi:hypothetical protein
MGLSLLSSIPNPQQQVESLQRELYQRNRQLNEAEEALRQEKAKTLAMERGVQQLRDILGPLFGGLKLIFGEIDAMGVGETIASPKTSAVWESWKQKLSPAEGRAIDALLLHGEMTVPQLRIHIGCATRTAQNIASSLSGKGLAVRMGGKIRLKEL